MIELYHNDMSVCAQKVRFALGEKALDWKSRHLNLRAGDQQKPEYVKLNPNAVHQARWLKVRYDFPLVVTPHCRSGLIH